LGAFHYRVFLRDSSESARDNDIDESVNGIEECSGSIVIEDDDVFFLVNEDYFCNEKVLVTVKLCFEDLVYQEVNASLEWVGGLFK